MVGLESDVGSSTTGKYAVQRVVQGIEDGGLAGTVLSSYDEQAQFSKGIEVDNFGAGIGAECGHGEPQWPHDWWFSARLSAF